MITGMATAPSGLSAHGTIVDTAAGNLANLSTTGYKSTRAHLGTLGGGATGRGGTGQGVQVLAMERSSRSGPLINTGAPSDLAIQGSGFFQIQQDGGLRYTRDGAFHLDKDRYLVDTAGNLLQPEIQLPPEAASFRVDPAGRVTASDAGGRVVFNGELTLQTFPNPAALASLGGNAYEPTAASGPATTAAPGTAGAGSIHQGFLEGAEVDPAREMMNLILGQRGFEANLKTIQTADTLVGEVINLRA